MHDIWNPWHGCVKASEGCAHCYMFFLDRQRGADGSRVYRTRNFNYPVQRDRSGAYKIKSGELIRVCMTSDFFLPEADAWREEAWGLIKARPDVKFFLLTKRPERFATCLPHDWGDGWSNVMLNVSAENDARARERIPVLLETPAAHRGVMCAPLIGGVDLAPWLATGKIEQVIAGGENYDGARPCRYEWVRRMSDDCRAADVTFAFIETGTVFEKDGRTYTMPSKRLQTEQAFKSGLSYQGKPIEWELTDPIGLPLEPEWTYEPYYGPQCASCGSRLICNGCSRCGACG